MSLGSIWSGNFHQLRNTLGINQGSRLLRLGTCGISLDTCKWKPHVLTTKVEAARSQKQDSSKTCNLKLELLDGKVGRTIKSKAIESELTEFKDIQLRNTLQSNHGSNVIRLGKCQTLGSARDTDTWKPRVFITKVQAARSHKQENSNPCNLKLEFLDGADGSVTKSQGNKSEMTEFNSIQYCDVQKKIADGHDSGQFVTVFVFDIETTGFSPHRDRIIEIAIRDLSGGKNSTFQTLVNPEQYVPNSHVHGISTRMVNRSDVPRWKDLIPILQHFVRSRQKAEGQVLWVAHNGRRFDVRFIVKEFSRCSVEVPSNWVFLDTLPLARELVKPDGSKLSSLTLEALREYYGIPSSGSAHRAMSDVNLLSLIFQRMSFDMKLSRTALLGRSFRPS